MSCALYNNPYYGPSFGHDLIVEPELRLSYKYGSYYEKRLRDTD
ncbi:13633_t:CDS:1, partial [Funneliformis caledonium]